MRQAKRIIEGLQWAKWTSKGFKNVKSGIKAMRAGQLYEKAFTGYLEDRYGEDATVEVNPWFEFADCNGYGWCSPDALYYDYASNVLIICECKIAFTYRRAYAELRTLYAPVVRMAYGLTPKLVQVCKYLKPSAKRVVLVNSIEDIINSKKEIFTWNWRNL